MAPREELLVILDLTSTVLRAGVGVTDLIRGPLLELPTRIGRKKGARGTQVEDYLVGHYLSQEEAKVASDGPSFDIVFPLEMDPQTGFNVTDWVGLEAIFRYALHVSLQLARPPLAHPTVVSVPPSLPHATTDRLHRLLFERLLVPSLLLSSRPFFAAGASGVTSALVLDVGWRGEGCEVSVVHENQVLEAPGGSRLGWVDEGVLDDYAAVQIWQENRVALLDAFKRAKLEAHTKQGTANGELERDDSELVLTEGELLDGVRRIVGELKNQDMIGFASKHYQPVAGAAGGDGIDGEDDGSFDVAKAVVEGKVSDIVNKKKSTTKSTASSAKPDGDYVTIPNPFSPPPPPASVDLTVPAPEIPPHANVTIGPSRHAYLEPLFFPQVLSTQLSSKNPHAREIGLTYFEHIQVPHAGIQELIGAVLNEIEDKDAREAVSENLIVVSSGRVACNKALGSTLVPLLSPYVQSPVAIDLYSEGGPTMNKLAMKFARTPDYFSNFKRHGGDWAVYLGQCIMGKLLIGDQQSKLFMSKADYAQKGPAYYRQLDLIA